MVIKVAAGPPTRLPSGAIVVEVEVEVEVEEVVEEYGSEGTVLTLLSPSPSSTASWADSNISASSLNARARTLSDSVLSSEAFFKSSAATETRDRGPEEEDEDEEEEEEEEEED
jgi:hypothetical protein